MLKDLINYIPGDLIKFMLVALFSLLIGLEQRRHYIKMEVETLFGTDRTFTLIGILGFILYIIGPLTLTPFISGGVGVALLLGIYYFQKIQFQQRFGITSIIMALITYCLAPLIYTQPQWLVLLIVICLLVIVEIKENLLAFSTKFDNNEFTSLAKFLVLTGVILPLLPDEPISAVINISPYRFWLAIVVVSAISYLSYLLRKFIFPSGGILVTGILGGLYSSTATTVILAKKSKEVENGNQLIAAVFMALIMMYLRIFLLALFFNRAIALSLLPYFGILILICAGLAFYFNRFYTAPARIEKKEVASETHQNPLEFKTALLFGILFVVFALVTGYVIKRFGGGGIHLLSIIVGVTDIDPFILNLMQGKWSIENSIIVFAILNAITSNNVLKFIYAYSMSDKGLRKGLIIGFGILIVSSVLLTLIPF